MKKNYEEKLPKIDDINDRFSRKVFFIVFAIFYLVYYCGVVRYFVDKSRIFENISFITSLTLSISMLVFMGIVLCIIFWQRLKRDAKLLFKNFRIYFKYNGHIFLRYFWLYILSTILIAVLFEKLGVETKSTNELNLSQVPFWLLALLALFSAPIVEEGMFRWIIRKITNNKWVFIAISGFLFGLIHVNYWGAQELYQLVFLLQYGILGMMLAESYYNTNNLLASSLLHGTWNFVMLLLELVLLPLISN